MEVEEETQGSRTVSVDSDPDITAHISIQMDLTIGEEHENLAKLTILKDIENHVTNNGKRIIPLLGFTFENGLESLQTCCLQREVTLTPGVDPYTIGNVIFDIYFTVQIITHEGVNEFTLKANRGDILILKAGNEQLIGFSKVLGPMIRPLLLREL